MTNQLPHEIKLSISKLKFCPYIIDDCDKYHVLSAHHVRYVLQNILSQTSSMEIVAPSRHLFSQEVTNEAEG